MRSWTRFWSNIRRLPRRPANACAKVNPIPMSCTCLATKSPPIATVTQTKPARVLIVGCGFGGLFAARALRGAPIELLVIDHNNYHLFQPLLYQVASAALAPADIAQPIRRILRGQANASVMLEIGRASCRERG